MRSLCSALVLLALASSRVAAAGGLLPGPEEAGFDPALAAKADRYVVQLHALLTGPIGFGLNANISDPEHRELVERFLVSDQRDFLAFSGVHPYLQIDEYGDYTHAAIFGGAQIAGDAFRYAVLRDQGGSTEAVDEARAIFIRNLDALDWLTRITGTSGVVARGIRRISSEPGEPTIPGELPELVPLFDESDRPLPEYKIPTWRADRSGQLPFLIWVDDASRDTMVGYVFALGAAYDIGAGDPAIPAEKIDRLREHAAAIGLRLIESVEVAEDVESDLVIQDADGRPTTYHALSAEEFAEGIVSVESSNGFNALMSTGMLRTLYHVSGEPKIWERYRELVTGPRDYLGAMERALSDLVYFRELTNYSVVNMAFLASYGLLRYENDPELASRMRRIFETELYDVGVERDPRGLGLSFFDFMFSGFREAGISGIGAEALADGISTLKQHPAPPYWDLSRLNCDAQEIAALDCVLDDGTRIALSNRRGYGGERVVAVEPLPIAVRPPSDFMWRSDPHAVNGGGRDRLNFGGDFHVAYWMGRFLTSTSSGAENISPIARGEPVETESDCGCSSSRPPRGGGVGGALAWLCLLVVPMLRWRVRDREPPS